MDVNKMVEISVVIPVYNVEKYLRECLESIINQTFKDIEIICINDGSTDNSLKILKEYEAIDGRIFIFSQENKGHASATNFGINLAQGKYLYLMDSDDILKENALELTYKNAEENDVDFVIFKSLNYDNQKDRIYKTEVYSMDSVYEIVKNNVFNYEDLGNKIFHMNVTPWSKLYKREFIFNNNIKFPEGLIFDDNIFFYESMLKAKRITFLNEYLFIRRWHKSSSTMQGDLRYLDSIEILNLIFDLFIKHGLYEKYKVELHNKKFTTLKVRYDLINYKYKTIFYQAVRNDYINTLYDEKMYGDLKESLNKDKQKIVERILICEYPDYIKLFDFINNTRRTYKKKYHDLIPEYREVYLKYIETRRLKEE